jgi:hypothetical protein
VAGDISPPVIPAPFSLGQDLAGNQALAAVYKLPPHKRHESKILPGTILPAPLLTEWDTPREEMLWHEKQGGGGGGGGRGGGGRGGGGGGGGYHQHQQQQQQQQYQRDAPMQVGPAGQRMVAHGTGLAQQMRGLHHGAPPFQPAGQYGGYGGQQQQQQQQMGGQYGAAPMQQQYGGAPGGGMYAPPPGMYRPAGQVIPMQAGRGGSLFGAMRPVAAPYQPPGPASGSGQYHPQQQQQQYGSAAPLSRAAYGVQPQYGPPRPAQYGGPPAGPYGGAPPQYGAPSGYGAPGAGPPPYGAPQQQQQQQPGYAAGNPYAALQRQGGRGRDPRQGR